MVPTRASAAATSTVSDPTLLRDAGTGNLRAVEGAAPVDAVTMSPSATQLTQPTLKTETVRLKVMREKKSETSLPDSVSSTARLRPPTSGVSPTTTAAAAPKTSTTTIPASKGTIKVEATPPTEASAPAAATGADEVRRTVRIKPMGQPGAAGPFIKPQQSAAGTVVLRPPSASTGAAAAGKPSTASSTIKLSAPPSFATAKTPAPAAGGAAVPPPPAAAAPEEGGTAKRTLRLTTSKKPADQTSVLPSPAGTASVAAGEAMPAVLSPEAAMKAGAAKDEDSSLISVAAALVTVLALGAVLALTGMQVYKYIF